MGERLKDVELSKTSVTSPGRAVSIQIACCPNGCNLMCPDVKIHDLNSICVTMKYKGKAAFIYLDPEFGSYHHITDLKIPVGEIVTFYCPHCGRSLTSENQICGTCSAPVFSMNLPGEGEIFGCLRKGCFDHTLQIESFEALQLQIEEDFIKVIM